MLTFKGWELYLRERAFRCVSGEIRIPVHPPLHRSCLIDAQISNFPLEGVDGFLLSDGPSTSDAFSAWWRPYTVGAQTRVTYFLGDIILGSVMMTDWIAYVWEPTHLDQIATLTHQVDQLSFYIRQMGGDPAAAYSWVLVRPLALARLMSLMAVL